MGGVNGGWRYLVADKEADSYRQLGGHQAGKPLLPHLLQHLRARPPGREPGFSAGAAAVVVASSQSPRRTLWQAAHTHGVQCGGVLSGCHDGCHFQGWQLHSGACCATVQNLVRHIDVPQHTAMHSGGGCVSMRSLPPVPRQNPLTSCR
jgi:hypothetical protein